jgi:hypothetical protein
MASKPLPFKPDLEGRPAVVIAGGPSLTKEDCEYAEKSGAFIIGINDAYTIAACDVVYASDHPWLNHHWRDLKYEHTIVLTQVHANNQPIDLPIYYVEGQHGCDMASKRLNFGGNSGFSGVHLASLWGAGQIVLLGFDMQAKQGKRHWFGDHYGPLHREAGFDAWIRNFEQCNCPTPIINCSRDTALTCFPRATIQEVL